MDNIPSSRVHREQYFVLPVYVFIKIDVKGTSMYQYDYLFLATSTEDRQDKMFLRNLIGILFTLSLQFNTKFFITFEVKILTKIRQNHEYLLSLPTFVEQQCLLICRIHHHQDHQDRISRKYNFRRVKIIQWAINSELQLQRAIERLRTIKINKEFTMLVAKNSKKEYNCERCRIIYLAIERFNHYTEILSFDNNDQIWQHWKKIKRSRILRVTINHKKVGKWVPFCCTLGGGVDLGLGITYEELCIKIFKYFDWAKKILSTLQKNFSEKLKISVLKKTQNILKIKSCKENANLNNWINRYRYAISITYEELCIKIYKYFDWAKKILSTLQKKFFRKIENFSCL
ncbi:hypothetical protein AGLY_009282 [Aphis glycines]|uniref:Uncharacterized protein n=1 Tax=Aphis glycines TaxID=307491 RepID=A0A6G0TI37_APHGL|nr:hypothetical protein AGLY_009282 [Aphis glycines]